MHDVVDVEDLRRQHLLPAEREELTCQRRRSLPGLPDLLDRLPQLGAFADVIEEQIAVAVDDRQQVVEVVRHAARELAERVHFLRLTQLGLEMPPLGDIFGNPGHTDDLPALISDRERAIANPANGAVGTHDPVLFVVGSGDLVRERGLGDALTIVGVNRGHPRLRRGVHGLACLAPDRLVSGADVRDLMLVRRRQPEHLGDALGDLPEALLTGTQRFVGKASFRDVLCEGHETPTKTPSPSSSGVFDHSQVIVRPSFVRFSLIA